MLKLAITVKDELKKKFQERAMDDDLKWYQAGYAYFNPEIVDSEWSVLQMVSVSEVLGEQVIVGFLKASIDRECYFISGLGCVSFAKTARGKSIFAADLRRFLKMLRKRKFKKMNWTVVVGNPIEKAYDKLAKTIGAYVVGTHKYDVLIDGEYYDRKLYEWINDYYECTHCGHREKKEEEVMCWKCGLGEMVYHNPFVW